MKIRICLNCSLCLSCEIIDTLNHNKLDDSLLVSSFKKNLRQINCNY